MAKREWAPAINSFLSSSENNYFKALRMSTHLDSALHSRQSDPDIQVLYNYFHPFHVSFYDSYSIWDAQIDQQMGSTVGVKELLKHMTKNLNGWILQINVAGILKGMPEYKNLFPKGRYPFQNGPIADRIKAVEILGILLAEFTALAATKTQVDTYWQQLDTARENQLGKKSITRTNSTTVEAERIKMCKAQYYVLGGLMQKFADTPSNIEMYFLVEEIRNNRQKFFTGRVKANNNTHISKRSLKPNQHVRLNNVGLTPLTFYFAQNNFGNPIGNLIVLKSEEDKTLNFADFNAPDGKYLFIKNNEKFVDGHFEITIG